MRWMVRWVAILLLCLTPVISWARGGGGCLAEGTRVLTPQGTLAIETLKKGDPVWSVKDGELQRAEVLALTVVQPEEYLEISTSASRLEVTPEHSLMVARGEYRIGDLLKAGDTVYLVQNGKLEAAKVQSVHRIAARRPAYNLLVSPGGTFVTENFVVHNKGCFLPESQVLRTDGTETPISAVKPGDELLAFESEGHMVRTRVREVIQHEVEEYIVLKTEGATLRVTAEHPFYVGRGTYKTVEALKEGDSVFAWDGQWLSKQQIVSWHRVHERVQVFNLQTDQPNTFFAGGIAVHNKGGGCFPQGTKIATPNGSVPIEALGSGDEVLAVHREGRTVRANVKTIFVSRSPVLRIETLEGALFATEGHPVSLGGNRFRQAGEIHVGDRIVKWKGGRLVARRVRGVSSLAGDELVFNLQVDDPNTFIAEGIVVHNKGGGCFPTGTLIRTPWGETSIEKLSQGDPVLAVGPDGRILQTQIEKIFNTRAIVLVIETDRGSLRATTDHPVGLSGGGFVPAGQLRSGQKVLVWKDGNIQSAAVLRISLEGTDQQVYNLSVGWPNTFLASNFVTHNKGGSSSSSRSSSRSSGGSSDIGETIGWILFGFMMLIGIGVIFSFIKQKVKGKSENLYFNNLRFIRLIETI